MSQREKMSASNREKNIEKSGKSMDNAYQNTVSMANMLTYFILK